MRVQGKVAIVTGAAGGIGGACAAMLAREGAKVILTDTAETTGKAQAARIGGVFRQHDVASEQGWADIVASTVAEHGRLDVLVNVAAIEGDLVNDCGESTSLAEWRRVMSVNLDGTFLGCRTAFAAMYPAGIGSIVNIASTASFAATPVALAYGASKAGVEQLTRSFAALGARDGKRVRCNSVHPGMIKTRMTDENIAHFGKAAGLSFEAAEALATKAIPFGARGHPDDIAALVLYLASDEAAYVTGTAFRVDGGWTMVQA